MPTRSRSASGYSTWRVIAEELRREIVDGGRPAGSRLPTEAELALRFSVNRHTVRRAVAQLAADGLVSARRGSGTYVAPHSVIMHRIGTRTRLNDSLARRGTSASGRLLESAVEADPPAEVTRRLALRGGPALRVEGVRIVDGVTISRATSWFVAELVPGLELRFAATGSITAALRDVGVPDYVRVATVVGARPASVAESADMDLAPGAVVLVVRALDALPDGTPLQLAITRFRADRVELDVEHAPAGSD